MKRSTDRILTTHVGSLPRPGSLLDLLEVEERGLGVNREALRNEAAATVKDIVARQVASGIDVVSDGEMSKIGYATYIKDRYHGFSGDSPRRIPGDLKLYPNYVKKIAAQGETPKLARPMCTGEISVKDEGALTNDIENLTRSVTAAA